MKIKELSLLDEIEKLVAQQGPLAAIIQKELAHQAYGSYNKEKLDQAKYKYEQLGRKIDKLVLEVENERQRKNPAGPGYHDVTLKYKLQGKHYEQDFLNVRGTTRGSAQQRAIKALEDTAGPVQLTGMSMKEDVLSNRNPKGSEVQSIHFAKTGPDKWTEAEAKAWLKDHKYKFGYNDIKENWFNFRQEEPKKFKRFARQKNKDIEHGPFKEYKGVEVTWGFHK